MLRIRPVRPAAGYRADPQLYPDLEKLCTPKILSYPLIPLRRGRPVVLTCGEPGGPW